MAYWLWNLMVKRVSYGCCITIQDSSSSENIAQSFECLSQRVMNRFRCIFVNTVKLLMEAPGFY